MTGVPVEDAMVRHRSRYRVDFALITIAGNQTRYEVLRPLVDADSRIEARWAPIRTWVQGDWLRFLPGPYRLRMRHLLDSRSVLFARPDAVVMHAFETYSMYMLLKSIRRARTAVVWSSDGAPPPPQGAVTARIRRHAVGATDLFVPFSEYAARVLVERYPEVDPARVVVIHPGLALAQWPMPAPRPPGDRFRLLFVGGDAERKGLDTLVDAYESGLLDTCSLHVMTHDWLLPPALKRRLEALPNVRLELDRRATREVYLDADAFVLPTNFDLSSWVALEAMATGIPVVITGVGGIPDIVEDGETGLVVPPRTPEAIVTAIRGLVNDGSLRARLRGSARRRVERRFDAEQNTARMMDLVVQLVDQRDQATAVRPEHRR